MTSKETNFPISHNPEYDYSCTAEQPSHKQNLRQPNVIAPTEPPDINHAAARVLLRVLLAAHQRLHHPEDEER